MSRGPETLPKYRSGQSCRRFPIRIDLAGNGDPRSIAGAVRPLQADTREATAFVQLTGGS